MHMFQRITDLKNKNLQKDICLCLT